LLYITASGNNTPGQIQLIIILLVVTLMVALVSRRMQLPYTLVLVFVGLIIGFLPFIASINLEPDIVLFLFLPALLFEGAWNVDIAHLRADWFPVLLLAVPGLIISLALLAVVLHVGIGLGWLTAILLGAMISPTDPVAVIALLRQLGMSDRLRTIVEGESLFNDGVGAAAFDIVLVLLLPMLGLVSSAQPLVGMIILEAFWLLFGGLALGIGIAWLVTRLLRRVDDYLIEITVTFSVAYGVYLIGVALHTSGLLAVVGAGLVLGHYSRKVGMSERTLNAAYDVWEFIGYVANSLLFLLLGIQIGESHLLNAIPGIVWALVGVIVGRVLIVYTLIPLQDILARRLHNTQRRNVALSRPLLPAPRPLPVIWRPLLILSGLRGALSIALVLSLPSNFPERNLLTSIVYGVVLVTLLGQGLGLHVLLPHWPKEEAVDEFASSET
jgi:CPA1 family monovalent cation:H+ antiporter